MNQFLECAKVINTHGIKGVVKLENMCDTPQVLAKLRRYYIKENDTFTEVKVISSSVNKNLVLSKIDGIDTVEQAAALKGTIYYANRDDFNLDKNTFFIDDLIGTPVIDIDTNITYGTIKNVLTPAGQSIYVIQRENNKEFMIPAVKEFIKRIDKDDNSIKGVYVHLIEGMLE